MSIVLPDWVPLAYPDQEMVYIDMLEPIWGVGKVVTFFPQNAPDGTIWVQRIGGGEDEAGITDFASMRVSCYHDTRNLAVALSNQVQRVILGYKHRYTPGNYLIDYAAMDEGGSIDPDLDPDDRRVTARYTTGMRRQYHLVG